MYQETMSREKFQKLEVDERRAESVNSNDQPEIFKLNNVCLINIFSFLPIPERIRIQRGTVINYTMNQRYFIFIL